MALSGCVLHCKKDIFGRTVVFQQKNYDKHKLKHPELRGAPFFPGKIMSALTKPTFTVAGYTVNTVCYYLEEFRINGIMKYTKVIVQQTAITIDGQKVFCVKTAFRTDDIKEQKYGIKLQYH